MSLSESRISPRSVAELSLLVSRIGRRNLKDLDIPLASTLQVLWLKTRSLERHWASCLKSEITTDCQDLHALSKLSSRIVTTDMLLRTWGTLLTAIDSRNGGTDAIRLVRNATNGFTRVRNVVLAQLLRMHDSEIFRLIEIDRIFRRCERWTDVLIGSMAPACQTVEFAYVTDRAQDFAEETTLDCVTGPNPADHFVSAGLRLNFVRHLPSEPFVEPEIAGLVVSILSSIPENAFRREGPLKSLLELRMLEGQAGGDRLSRFADPLEFPIDDD